MDVRSLIAALRVASAIIFVGLVSVGLGVIGTVDSADGKADTASSTWRFTTIDMLLPAPQPTLGIGPLRALAPRSDRVRPSRSRMLAAARSQHRPFAQGVPGPSRPISPGLLIALIRACAPSVNPVTQAAVISVESSGDAWALHDDNDDREYRPRSFAEAVGQARYLILTNRHRYGTSDAGVDVGVSQINSNNFNALRVDAGWMLHPCPNLRVSSRMIAGAYDRQYSLLAGVAPPMRDQLAIRRALQVYNSGKASGDDRYVQNVLRALHSGLVLRVAQLAETQSMSDVVTQPLRLPQRHLVQGHDDESTGLFVHEDPPLAAPRTPAPVAGGGNAWLAGSKEPPDEDASAPARAAPTPMPAATPNAKDTP